MCTQQSPDDITVCDTAITSVRQALAGHDAVTFEHLPGEGTRVTNHEPSLQSEFRDRLAAAIAPHGGSLLEPSRPPR